MKLYVCFGKGGSPDHHKCAKAFKALTEAGYQPELKKVYGSGYLPGLLQTKGRRKIEARTGSYFMPVLELDDGNLIYPSDDIVAWAKKHPN